MKIKELLVPLAFVFVVTFFVQSLIQHFAAKHQTDTTVQVKPGQSFIAPKKEQLIKPLMTEVDFLDADVKCIGQATNFTTKRATGTIASCGAAFTSYSAKRIPGVAWEQLTALQVDDPQKRDETAFLVALDEKTPLDYHLIAESYENGIRTLVYRCASQTCDIEKTYKLYDDSFKVDLTLTIDPHIADGVQARILFPAPYLQDNGAIDAVRAVMVGDNDAVEKFVPREVEGRLWVMPSLFGVEDRYFVNSLVADAGHFVQRAYYKAQGEKRLIAILEGPQVQQKMSWELSFYCGPKQTQEFAAVDSRLDATLDYGWLSPLAKLALAILKFIYQFIHSYGWAIILFTLLMKLLLLPFTRQDEMAKKANDMKKKLQYLEQKYKNDPEGLAREKTELIRKHGVSDMLGCLPMLVQFPIIIALNRALSTSIELYRAPFAFWIPDLSAYDPLYILPLLTGLGLIVQGINVSDPRQKLMSIMMGFLVSAILVNLAAGVTLFICVSTWLSIGQTHLQKFLKRA